MITVSKRIKQITPKERKNLHFVTYSHEDIRLEESLSLAAPKIKSFNLFPAWFSGGGGDVTQVHINRMHLESSIKLNAVIYKERVCGFFVFLIFPPTRMKKKKFSSLQDYFLAFILSLLSLDKRIKLQERTNRKENTRYESVVSKTLFFFLSLSPPDASNLWPSRRAKRWGPRCASERVVAFMWFPLCLILISSYPASLDLPWIPLVSIPGDSCKLTSAAASTNSFYDQGSLAVISRALKVVVVAIENDLLLFLYCSSVIRVKVFCAIGDVLFFFIAILCCL